VPNQGVKIHYISYWAAAFLDAEVENTQVPIRFDPFDVGTAYAFVKGRWVRCLSEHYAQLAGRSERELMLATAELRRRHQRHAQQLSITARQLADFLASIEAEEVLLGQRLRDAEAHEVIAQMGNRAPSDQTTTDAPDLVPATLPAACAPAPETLVLYEDY
jgi:putative transposase